MCGVVRWDVKSSLPTIAPLAAVINAQNLFAEPCAAGLGGWQTTLVLVPSRTSSSQIFVRSTWNESWIYTPSLVKRSKEIARLTINHTKKGCTVLFAAQETIWEPKFRRGWSGLIIAEANSVVSGSRVRGREKNCERILVIVKKGRHFGSAARPLEETNYAETRKKISIRVKEKLIRTSIVTKPIKTECKGRKSQIQISSLVWNLAFATAIVNVANRSSH